ncbi:MAG: SpoIIE family protein phosphatase [Candidatus Kapabacteria bacterium]|nr:SpoIIE family protein phosphatase [Candidatus Kapabacteria bacterium]
MPPQLRTSPQASSFSLTSLLDLSSRLSETDSTDRILNAALLSVMGKLRCTKACVLEHDNSQLSVRQTKGVAPFHVPNPGIEDVTSALSDPRLQVLSQAGIAWYVPVVAGSELLAVLCFGPSIGGLPLTDDLRDYLDIVRSITATALKNASMVRSLIDTSKELERRNLLVTSLLESSREFSVLSDRPGILRTLSYRLMGQLMISNFGIILYDAPAEDRLLCNSRSVEKLSQIMDILPPIHQPIRVDDLPNGAVAQRLAAAGVSALAPLNVHGQVRAVLAMCGKLNGMDFTDEELLFAEALGNAAMIAVENDRLFHEEIAKRMLENELGIAATIQRGLLPLAVPPTPGLSVAAHTRPNKQVSGDYYDIIPLDDHRTLFCIADVAGKGVPAAILMANVQAALNVLASLDLPLGTLAERLNKLICENTEPEVFVTLFLAVIDANTETMHYVNAGHNPPVLYRSNGDVELLTEGGVLAGVIPDPPPYKCGVGGFHSGDVLVLYTDGITEARDIQNREYGVSYLVQALAKCKHMVPSQIVEAIVSDLNIFVGDVELADDSSIVVIKRHDRSY